jgi:aspartyl-tRNA(Asn)/glutamyl-tRNA(Gln) amidotransferase subunit C
MPDAQINPEQIRHVAKLARLAIDEEHLRKFVPQIEAILGYVAQLQKVHIEGVEPMAHAVPLCNVLRTDEVGPTLPVEKVLQSAPQIDGEFFRVPKVIGGDEDSAG